MSEATQMADAALKQAELMGKVNDYLGSGFRTTDPMLTPEDLAELFNMFPDRECLKHNDYPIDLSKCRQARRDFGYWHSIAENLASNRVQKLRAARMIGFGLGLWHMGLGGFKMPLQRVLIIPSWFFEDKELCDALLQGFAEQIEAYKKIDSYRISAEKVHAYFLTEFEYKLRPLRPRWEQLWTQVCSQLRGWKRRLGDAGRMNRSA